MGSTRRAVPRAVTWGFYAAPRINTRIRGWVLAQRIRLAGGACGPGLRVERNVRWRQPMHRGIQLGRDVYLGVGTTIDCPRGGEFIVGNQVTLTQGCFVSAVERVRIGDDVLIGEYCSLRDGNHGTAVGTLIRSQPMVAEPIEVGNDCWIGRGVVLLAGSHVAPGSVIGANAVFSGSLPPGSIAVGIPARKIKDRDDP